MLPASLDRFTSVWRARPALPASLVRSVLPLLILAVAGTGLALMLMWRDQSQFKPVFGKQERIATTEMLAVLDAEHVAYRLHPDSGQVLVPESQLGRVRMLLAAKGVVAKLPAGLELMDRNDPLGVSQFVQDVRFRRGLEGELAQSIMTLEAVDHARVHLAIAKSSSFVGGDGAKSAASVVLGLKPGRSLSNEQIAAAINLVAGSVAGLDPQRVSLVEQAGHLLSARVDLSQGFEASQGNDAAQAFQDGVRRNVRDLLAPVLGEENYRLSVTATVDNDKVQETREQYGDAPRLTSEAMREEQDRQQLALGVPGSLSNRPVNPPASGASEPAEGNASSARKNAASRQYAYDRNITQIQRSRGRLARLNVAVVLNNAVAPGGTATWSPEELNKVERLLSSGLGLSKERGDTLTVSPMSFPAAVAPLPWYQQRDTWLDAAGWLSTALAVLAGYLLLLRPLLRLAQQHLAPPRTQAAAGTELSPLLPGEGAPGPLGMNGAELPHAAQAALPGPSGSSGTAGEATRSALVPLLENYELPPPGSPVDVLVDHLKDLAAKEPERVAEVVKQWVQKKHERSQD